MRIVEYPFYMANVLCVIIRPLRHEEDRHQQNMKSDKIKNVKGTQSNKFELNAEPQLSQTYTAKRFFANSAIPTKKG